jgi:hypothetical protein
MTDWKECRRKRLWPNLRLCPDICVEGLKKITKTLSHEAGLKAEI